MGKLHCLGTWNECSDSSQPDYQLGERQKRQFNLPVVSTALVFLVLMAQQRTTSLRFTRLERKLDALLKKLDVNLNADVDKEVLALASSGKKIEAIKRHMEISGASRLNDLPSRFLLSTELSFASKGRSVYLPRFENRKELLAFVVGIAVILFQRLRPSHGTEAQAFVQGAFIGRHYDGRVETLVFQMGDSFSSLRQIAH